MCLPLVSHSGSGWSHNFLHLSPICLSFVSHSRSGWSHDFPHLSPICLSVVSHSRSGWSHDFPHLSPICLSCVSHSGSGWSPRWVGLVATLGPVGRMIFFTCLPFVPQTGLPVWGSYSLEKGCLPWSYDFDCVSRLASSECWVRLVA